MERINKIVAIEKEKPGNGKWSKVYYKVPRGRKIYSIYCYSKDITIDGINANAFHAKF